MKKISILIFTFITFLQAETITIVGDEWCPYNCKVEDKNQGYLVDITRAIFEKKGFQVEYKVASSWEKAVADTTSGKYTAIIGAYKTDARNFVFPETIQGVSKNSFFAKKSLNWTYQGVDSLKNIRLGAIKSYSYGNALDEYIAKNEHNKSRVQLISGNRAIYQNAKKVLYHTIDVMIEDPYVLEYYFKLKGSTLPFKLVGSSSEDDIYIAFSPNNTKSKIYASILSDGLKRLRESGELENILSKYALHDWE